jgi:type IV conjugative transfer system lipoprotein TraV
MKRLPIILCALLVTGCGAKSRWDCPYNDGASCMSMSEVDKEIKSGNAGKPKKKSTLGEMKKMSEYEAEVSPFTKYAPGNSPFRTQEAVLQLWVAPFEDTGGVFHQQNMLNVVVVSPRWLPPVVDDVSMREGS